jgi:tyrosine-protein phosphatase SIW14
MKRLILFFLLCLPLLAQQSPKVAFVQQNYTISLNIHVKNFGMVDEGVLYRGAQPDGQGLYDLSNFGIKTIVDLRGDRTVEREAVVVNALGMKFVNFPMKGLSAPTQTQIRQLMFLLKSLPKPIFIHCQHGEDRTGTAVAVWRMEYEGWSNLMAMAEAKFYHINPIQFGMKHFIDTFQPSKFLEYDEPVRR